MDGSAFVNGLENVNSKWELVEIIGEGTYGEVCSFIFYKPV